MTRAVVRPTRHGGAAPPSFVVELTEFSGPLDLLLTLIRDEQVDIYDIPIARIAEQFLRASARSLNEAADYLEMAARLLRIKAQMLLPRGAATRRGTIRARSSCGACSSISRSAKSSTSRPHGRGAPGALRAAYLPRARPPGRRSRCRSASCSRRSIECCGSRSEPTCTTSWPRAMDVAGAITVRSVLAMREHARWNDLVRRDAEPWEVLSSLLACSRWRRSASFAATAASFRVV